MSIVARSERQPGPQVPAATPPKARAIPTFVQDRIYAAILFIASLSILILVVAIALELVLASRESLQRFGWRFFTRMAWDPVHQNFGALAYILGTLYTSFWALLMAVPISIGAAIFLAELAPRWLRTPVSFLIELLAAIPSVVYGLWGIFVLSPWLVQHVETPISENATLSKFALFNAPPNGNDILADSLILAIMVLPYITAVSRDILRAIPRTAREGSYALGATRWETIQGVVLPYARAGIIGAVILGLGRALGETMAVTMVIGNRHDIGLSVLQPAYTMAAAIANEFSEATTNLYLSALFEVGLILFVITVVVNALARLLIWRVARGTAVGSRAL